jgi:hypothetical protein
LRKQFAKVRMGFFNSGTQVVIRLITPIRNSYEESYAKGFPFDKMVPGVLDPEMVEDTAKIANEAMNPLPPRRKFLGTGLVPAGENSHGDCQLGTNQKKNHGTGNKRKYMWEKYGN